MDQAARLFAKNETMRQDMYKVIVERPRRGGGFRSEASAPGNLEDSPKQEGLRRRHRSRKWLSENLRPLEHYLEAQVGRPWDNVFSEICAGIDRRNTVQRHIHQHLEDFVAIRVYAIDGVLHEDVGWRGRQPLESPWASRFYVDPRTGLLRLNKGRIKARRAYREDRRAYLGIGREDRYDDRRIVDTATQLHRIDGVWYRIDLAPITEQAIVDREIDAVRKTPLHRCPCYGSLKDVPGSVDLFGNADVYACGKRQLNARELRQYGLSNDDKL
jgi:hypothetical protein